MYLRVGKPAPLGPPVKGPYRIVERPSMSTIRVKVGTFKSGAENLQLHHWSNAKPATMRADATEGTMTTRGRPSKSTSSSDVHRATDESEADYVDTSKQTTPSPPSASEPVDKNSNERGKRPVRSTRNPAPLYVDNVTGPPPIPFSSKAGNSNCVRQPPTPNLRPWQADKQTIALLNYQISRHP